MLGYSPPIGFPKLHAVACAARTHDLLGRSLVISRFSLFAATRCLSLEGILLVNDGAWLEGCDSEDPNQIRLMHHDARWRQEFEQTRSSILQSCEGRVVAVEHIGSTAIGGLIARPIVDAIAVVADPVDLSDSAMLIEGLNFREIDLPEWTRPWVGTTKAVLLEKPRHGETTHRVYVVSQGSALLDQTTRLRDFFRGSPEAAIDFESKKVEIWKQSDGDASMYHASMDAEFESRTKEMER